MLDLDPRPEHVRWLAAAARVLSRTDRIMAGRDDLGFHLSEYGPAPAWSDGQNVFIKTEPWKRSWQDDGAVARLMGLNLHELCHIMLTPRIKELETARLRQVYNLAEDQRIESLFASLYTPAIPFFAQAVLDLIVRDGTGHDTLHVLVGGRKYLPAHIRDAARRAYQGDAAEWTRLMDEYLLLDWDTDRRRGIELIKLMADHLGANQVEPPSGCGTQTKRGGISQDESDEARERVAEAMADEDEAEDDGTDPDDDPTEAGTEEAEVEETDGAEDTDTADEGDAADATDDEPIEDSDDTGGEPGGDAEGEPEDEAPGEGDDTTEDPAEGEADSDTPTDGTPGDDEPSEDDEADEADDPRTLDEALEDLRNEAAEGIEAEATRVSEQIELELDRPQGEMGESLPRWDERVPVTDEARVAADGLRGVLAELMAAVDPGWESHRPQGRINVGRYLQREAWEPMDEIFDEWHPGVNDAMDLEIAVLVDTSSSMGYSRTGEAPAKGVAEAAWALKSALGQHGIPVAVMGYDTNSSLIYGESDVADPGYMPQPLWRDSTLPGEVLVEVGRHFQYSTHKRRILVTLTDGQWSRGFNLRTEKVDIGDVVASIDAELKVLLRFGMGGQDGSNLGFDEVHDVESTDALVDVVREAIVGGVARAGGRTGA